MVAISFQNASRACPHGTLVHQNKQHAEALEFLWLARKETGFFASINLRLGNNGGPPLIIPPPFAPGQLRSRPIALDTVWGEWHNVPVNR